MQPFQNTRMLQAARDAAEENRIKTGREPRHIVTELLTFVLIFFIASLVQSMLYMPFLMGFLYSGGVLSSALSSPGGSLMELTEQVMAHPPAWLTVVQLFSTSAIIAACCVYCRVIERRSLLSLGLTKRGALSEYAVGLGLGLVVFSLAVGLSMVTGTLTLSVNPAPDVGMLLLYLLGFMIQGMSEEILCRSYLMVSLCRGYPTWVAVLANALLFTLLHLANPGMNLTALLNLTLFGIFASLYTLRRGSIWGIGAFHTIWNFAQGNLFGIPVSGLSGHPSLLIASPHENGALIHGGAFGIEGGLAATLVLAAGCGILLFTKTKKSELVLDN